jgi:Ca2+-binding RTX toxin-like protein
MALQVSSGRFASKVGCRYDPAGRFRQVREQKRKWMRRASVFLVAATLLLALSAGAALARSITGDGEPNVIVGTNTADFIDGRGGDELYGLDGRDTLLGRDGNDTLSGGRGPDTLVGGPGDDLIFGGGGNDAIRGGPGNDTIVLSDDANGPAGADQVACGGGEDIVYVSSTDNRTLLDEEDCETVTNRPYPGEFPTP